MGTADTRRVASVIRLAPLLVALSFAVVPPAAAQREAAERGGEEKASRRLYRGPGQQAFEEGFRAWELGQWDKAVLHMAEALKADPDQPEAQVRMRALWLIPYIPSYYLSLACCKLERCAEVQRDTDTILKLLKDARGYIRDRYASDCQKCRGGTEGP